MTVFHPHLFIHLSIDVDGEETLPVDHAVRLALHHLAISNVITAHKAKTCRIMVMLGSYSKQIPMIQLWKPRSLLQLGPDEQQQF